jgi:hypothetical protein
MLKKFLYDQNLDPDPKLSEKSNPDPKKYLSGSTSLMERKTILYCITSERILYR